jgi:dolichol kinase
VTGEDRRQALHFAMTAFALALRWLEPWQAWALAGAAIVVNWLLLPALGWDKGVRREDGPFADGVKLYPVAVLAVLLLFPSRPQVAAAAGWGVMGVGDAASNVVGRRLGRPGFLGRSDRSLAGSVAFLLTAWPAALGLAMFVGGWSAASAWLPALTAAAAGMAAEFATIPRRLDDNLTVALAGAAAFHFASA